jgi:phage terminase large subunit GpA-like protein
METVEGRLEEWEGGHIHVHFPCPHCGYEHNYDFEADDPNPRPACCEVMGVERMVLVRWEPPRG